jgi:hypothetical protein
MAAPLHTCTKEECSVIRFSVSEGVKPTGNRRAMWSQNLTISFLAIS